MLRRRTPQRAFDDLYRCVAGLELRLARLSHTLRRHPAKRRAAALELMNFRLDDRPRLLSAIGTVDDSISTAAHSALTDAVECLEYAESALEYKDVPAAIVDLGRAAELVHQARIALDSRSTLAPSTATLMTTARTRKQAEAWWKKLREAQQGA